MPSKGGCVAGWKTAVHSAVGSYAVALWWGCKVSSVLPGEKDSHSSRPAVVLVKYTPVLRPIQTVCMLELEERKYRVKIPSKAACFRKEGAERSGPGTDSGSRV